MVYRAFQEWATAGDGLTYEFRMISDPKVRVNLISRTVAAREERSSAKHLR